MAIINGVNLRRKSLTFCFFNEAGWQAVWKGVREEEKKVHFKKEEGSHRKKAEEVSV